MARHLVEDISPNLGRKVVADLAEGLPQTHFHTNPPNSFRPKYIDQSVASQGLNLLPSTKNE
jgi:hypothetical protein